MQTDICIECRFISKCPNGSVDDDRRKNALGREIILATFLRNAISVHVYFNRNEDSCDWRKIV